MLRPIPKIQSRPKAQTDLNTRLFIILLVCGYLASGTGCHVLRIPSYRADPGCGDLAAGYPGGEQSCAPTVLPPLPGWLAAWHEKKQTPQPPDFPRFQPLPTRPMFTQPKMQTGVGTGAAIHYGHWPSAEDGGIQSENAPQSVSVGEYEVRDYTAQIPVPDRF